MNPWNLSVAVIGGFITAFLIDRHCHQKQKKPKNSCIQTIIDDFENLPDHSDEKRFPYFVYIDGIDQSRNWKIQGYQNFLERFNASKANTANRRYSICILTLTKCDPCSSSLKLFKEEFIKDKKFNLVIVERNSTTGEWNIKEDDNFDVKDVASRRVWCEFNGE